MCQKSKKSILVFVLIFSLLANFFILPFFNLEKVRADTTTNTAVCTQIKTKFNSEKINLSAKIDLLKNPTAKIDKKLVARAAYVSGNAMRDDLIAIVTNNCGSSDFESLKKEAILLFNQYNTIIDNDQTLKDDPAVAKLKIENLQYSKIQADPNAQECDKLLVEANGYYFTASNSYEYANDVISEKTTIWNTDPGIIEYIAGIVGIAADYVSTAVGQDGYIVGAAKTNVENSNTAMKKLTNLITQMKNKNCPETADFKELQNNALDLAKKIDALNKTIKHAEEDWTTKASDAINKLLDSGKCGDLLAANTEWAEDYKDPIKKYAMEAACMIVDGVVGTLRWIGNLLFNVITGQVFNNTSTTSTPTNSEVPEDSTNDEDNEDDSETKTQTTPAGKAEAGIKTGTTISTSP